MCVCVCVCAWARMSPHSNFSYSLKYVNVIKHFLHIFSSLNLI